MRDGIRGEELSVVRGGVGSVGHVGGLNGLALVGGDLVLDGDTVHLGDGVAVLNLNIHGLDLRVVDAVLGGDLPAGVLHGGGHGVSHGVGGEGSDSGVSVRSEELRIGLSIGLPLGDVADGGDGGSVTDDVSDLNALLGVLDLLGHDDLGGADVLGSGSAGLSLEDLNDSLAVRSGVVGDRGGSGQRSEELGVSLGIGSWGSPGEGDKTGDGKYLQQGMVTGKLHQEECLTFIILKLSDTSHDGKSS